MSSELVAIHIVVKLIRRQRGESDQSNDADEFFDLSTFDCYTF